MGRSLTRTPSIHDDRTKDAIRKDTHEEYKVASPNLLLRPIWRDVDGLGMRLETKRARKPSFSCHTFCGNEFTLPSGNEGEARTTRVGYQYS